MHSRLNYDQLAAYISTHRGRPFSITLHLPLQENEQVHHLKLVVESDGETLICHPFVGGYEEHANVALLERYSEDPHSYQYLIEFLGDINTPAPTLDRVQVAQISSSIPHPTHNTTAGRA